MKTERELIIVGSGPAGLTAAIYAGRGEMNPLVIEGFQAGGQLMTTTDVENYPGFVDGMTGPDLIANLRNQARKFGSTFLTEDVTAVDLKDPVKKIKVDRDTYTARAVIIATGARANYLGLKNEQRLKGRGVSACATCDGFFFRDKTVAVVGGGDSAMEEALFLTRFARKVFVIHRRAKLRASRIMAVRAGKNEKIRFVYNTVVVDVLGKDRVEGLKLKNRETGEETEKTVDGLFLAIGHTPNTGLFRDQLDTDAQGYILTSTSKSRMTATSLPGVFACGDVQDSRYQQAITAAGSGCMAALDAEKYLVEGD